jgi:4-hydroxybenzoate polyprenyltransferase
MKEFAVFSLPFTVAVMAGTKFLDRFRDWAAMARLPNVPTVWSNVFTAWMLANGGLTYILAGGKLSMIREPGPMALALLGGTLLYVAGTLFSELCDERFDRQYRPERPIPAGRVSMKVARWVAALSLVAGFFALVGASVKIIMVNLNGERVAWAYGDISSTEGAALALVFVILAYAFIHKRSGFLAVVLMGSCRVLLALAVTLAAREMWWETMPWSIALGLNVAGISWLARGESRAVPGGITGAVLLITLVPPAIAFLSRSLWNDGNNFWLGFVLWGLAVWWLAQPLRGKRDGPARGASVGRALAMLPVLDAMFLIPVCGIQWALVPLGCVAAALALRRVAAAT